MFDLLLLVWSEIIPEILFFQWQTLCAVRPQILQLRYETVCHSASHLGLLSLLFKILNVTLPLDPILHQQFGANHFLLV